MFGEIGKYLGLWGFVGLVLYAGYVLLADSPLGRIERTCLATEWANTTVSSVASLFSDEAETRTEVAMGELTLSCQYLVFRQFYKDEYERMKAAREAAEAAAAADGAQPEAQP
jgi:hypothetical protein